MRLWPLVLAVYLAAACAPVASAPPAPAPASGPAPPTTAAAPTHSAEIERLLAAARAAGETELHVSWAEDTLGGQQGAEKLAALVNRQYGTNIRIVFTPGRLDVVTGRLEQELAAGRRGTVDVFLGSELHIAPLFLRDALEPYDYPALAPWIPPEAVAPGNAAVQVASRVGGITYNTHLVAPAEVPRRLEDVLQPKWKGLIAATQTAIGFDNVAYRPEWSPERMKEFMRRLSGQVGGLIRGGEQERVASGEFLMLVLNTGSQEVHELRARGAPVAHAVPDDASTLTFHYLAVPRNAQRPNLAKLFIATVLSDEGQQLVYEIAHYDLHKRPGSRTATELAEVRARGITPLEVDVQFLLDHPERGQLRDELIKILVERPGG